MTIKILRKAALIEGVTLVLLLLVALPLKYSFGIPEAVKIIGPIHGIAFLVYLTLLTLSLMKDQIKILQWLVGVFAAFIPFGSFVFERTLLKKTALQNKDKH